MKNTIWMLVGMLMVVSGSAFANDDQNVVTAVDCRFHGAIKGAENCMAKIVICPDSKNECKNMFRLVCDGRVVYDDGVKVEPKEDVIKLRGIDHVDFDAPEVIIARPEHTPETVVGWLKLRDRDSKAGSDVSRGFCEVKTFPIPGLE